MNFHPEAQPITNLQYIDNIGQLLKSCNIIILLQKLKICLFPQTDAAVTREVFCKAAKISRASNGRQRNPGKARPF